MLRPRNSRGQVARQDGAHDAEDEVRGRMRRTKSASEAKQQGRVEPAAAWMEVGVAWMEICGGKEEDHGGRRDRGD